MSNPSRILLHVELNLLPGESVAVTRERIQKLMMYQVPTHEATVTADKKNPAIEEDDTSWLSPEECELLGIDRAALDLLS